LAEARAKGGEGREHPLEERVVERLIERTELEPRA
jgi:hypothetical protein